MLPDGLLNVGAPESPLAPICEKRDIARSELAMLHGRRYYRQRVISASAKPIRLQQSTIAAITRQQNIASRSRALASSGDNGQLRYNRATSLEMMSATCR